MLTALGHADVRVGVEEGLAVGAEAALRQRRALRALGPGRGRQSWACAMWTGSPRSGQRAWMGLVGCPDVPWARVGEGHPRALPPPPAAPRPSAVWPCSPGVVTGRGLHGAAWLVHLLGWAGELWGQRRVSGGPRKPGPPHPPQPPPTHRTARPWRFASRCTRPGHGRAPRRPPGSGRAPRGGRPGRRPGRRR